MEYMYAAPLTQACTLCKERIANVNLLPSDLGN